MADILLRPAAADDLPAVRALLVETWHDTYDALLGAQRVTEITTDWHSIKNLRRQLGQPPAWRRERTREFLDQGQRGNHVTA